MFERKRKEIPDELKLIEKVIPPQQVAESEINEDKYIIGEVNGQVDLISTYQQSNLTNIRQKKAFFLDLEVEVEKLTPEFVRVGLNRNFFGRIYDNFNEKVDTNFFGPIVKFFRYLKPNMEFADLNELAIEDLKNEKLQINLNSTGFTAALLKKNNLVILVDISDQVDNIYSSRIKTLQFYCEDKDNFIQEILFHSVDNRILTLVYKNKLVHYNIIQKEIKLIKEYSRIRLVKYSPDGLLILIVYNDGKNFSVLDACKTDNNENESIYSQNLFSFGKIKGLYWANDSSYFILHSEKEVYLYNRENMEFKSWTDFAGTIRHISITQDSKSFKIFTDDQTTPVYVIFNISNDFYYLDSRRSFHNNAQYYLHEEFKVSNKIFSFLLEDYEILKVRSNLQGKDNRLVLFLRNKKTNQKSISVYEMIKSKNIVEHKIRFLFSIYGFQNYTISNFELYTNLKNEEVLLISWDDKILSKTYLNFYY
jgi:hypothetical protein